MIITSKPANQHYSPVWYVLMVHIIFLNNQHLEVACHSEVHPACLEGLEVHLLQVLLDKNQLLRVSKNGYYFKL